jgi:hypothetical protein
MPFRVLIILLIIALVAGAVAGDFYRQSEQQAYLARYSQTIQILAKAASNAARQSSHPSGATRPDLSTIDTSSIESIRDAWGKPLLLCTNALDDTRPMIAVLSAGGDGSRDTTCADAMSGFLNGDDQLSSLGYEQVFARQALTSEEQTMVADYTNRCAATFDLLEKDTAINFDCTSMCTLFRRFSDRYGFHDTAPDWASCTASN